MSDIFNAARVRARARTRASSRRRAALAGASTLALTLALACGAHAQSFVTGPNPTELSPTPPLHLGVDARGVDLISGAYYAAAPAVSIGPADGGLTQSFFGSGLRDNLTGTATLDVGSASVSFGASTEDFTQTPGGPYVPSDPNGSSLASDATGLLYTLRDGTRIHLGAGGGQSAFDDAVLLVDYVLKPTGERLDYHYKRWAPADLPSGAIRLRAITSNRGYQLRYEYAADDGAGKFQISAVRSLNSTVDYCNADVDGSCALSAPGPFVSFSGSTVTDALSHAITTTFNGPVETISYTTGRVVTITRDADGRVVSYNDGATTWTYVYGGDSNTFNNSVSDGAGTSYVSGPVSSGLITVATDARGKATYYGYDAGRLSSVMTPEGLVTLFAHDDRGNITRATMKAKAVPGVSTPADRVWALDYTPGCSSATSAACNQPNFATDPDGHTTSYAYNPDGTLLSVTRPAAQNNVQPQTRYGYTVQAAVLKDASGGLVVAGSGVVLPQSVSSCATGAANPAGSTTACADGAQAEVKATLAYDNANRIVSSVTQTDGAGTPSSIATTAFGYDAVGNLLTRDGPLPGSGDTTRYRYDAMRQLTAVIDPDPDGAGPELPRARAYGYNGDGQVTAVQQGQVNSQADSDWSTFQSLTDYFTAYDAAGRPTAASMGGAGEWATSYVQYGYDGAGRLQCSTVRMNPARFAAPISACDLSTPNDPSVDPDRITKYDYDAASNVIAMTAGLNVPGVQRIERTRSYRDDGQVWTEADGKGNTTTYGYDGFDRLSTITYPIASGGSPTATHAFGYDGEDHVTSETLRDGTTVTHDYDALGRLTRLGTTGATFGYDNLGRLTSASNASGTLITGYDNRGNLVSQTGPFSALGYVYDAADRRTGFSGPGASVTYQYDAASKLTDIIDSGVGTVSHYAYNGRDQRTVRTGPNGAGEGYGYDPAGRQTSLTLADSPVTFGLNPAGQIVSRTSPNAAFASATPASASLGYTSNALNQYTAVNGAALSYDGRGNLTTDGSRVYGYDAADRLTISGGTALSYDALGRLASAGSTRFVYDGPDLVAETDLSGTVTKRYVHGPGDDEPLLGCDVGLKQANCAWMLADERGSVVSTLNASGGVSATAKFDDDGQGAPLGRFGFTGQAWLPEVGVYHYKARAYSPRLGRFMQADPIGYIGGMNAYQYAGNDAVSARDPTGLITVSGVDVTACLSGLHTADGDCLKLTLGSVVSGLDVSTLGSLPGTILSAAGGPGGGAPQTQLPDCNTVLPNGRTIGQDVRDAIADARDQALWDGANLTGTDITEQTMGNILAAVGPSGPLDYKLKFKGQEDPSRLADEGNFAIGAVMTPFYTKFGANLVAQIYATGLNMLGRKADRFMAPNGMDKSAAANLPRGEAAAGCPLAHR